MTCKLSRLLWLKCSVISIIALRRYFYLVDFSLPPSTRTLVHFVLLLQDAGVWEE